MDIFDYNNNVNKKSGKNSGNKMFVVTVIAIIVAVVMGAIALVSIFIGSKSAYDIAVDNGYSGSETEWLLSLQGDDAASLTVYELYEVYLETYPDGTMDDFLSAYLSIDYSSTEAATSLMLRSAVSVYAYFTLTYSGGSGWFNSTSYVMSSLGSGVIIDLDSETGEAYIMTNYHVVYESTADTPLSEMMYIYPYGKETVQGLNSDFTGIACSFVGGSTSKDIAIIKAEKNDVMKGDVYRGVDFAESDSARVGSTCIAVGNAEGDGISATTGVVSMESEYIEVTSITNSSTTTTHRVLRTDAAINSGNSGGGLYNAQGELIGIVNAKTVSDDVEGIGNAIPVSVASGIASVVMDGQKNTSGSYCKLMAGFTTNSYNSYASLDSDGYVTTIDEVTITGVVSGSPADGIINEDDILLSFSHNGGNDVMITKSYQVSDYLYNVRDNDTMVFKVLRNSTVVELDAITFTDDCATTI